MSFSLSAPHQPLTAIRLLSTGLFVLFLFGLWVVTRPFLVPFIWALIIVSATWPAFQWIKHRCGMKGYAPALLMTTLVTLVIALAVIPVSFKLTSEISTLLTRAQDVDPQAILTPLKTVPYVGERLAGFVEPLISTKGAALDLLTSHRTEVVTAFGVAARGVSQAVLTFIATIVICYLLYRHGPSLATQLKSALIRLGGESFVTLMHTVNNTVRGAAYGVVLTALAQGFLAGIGYLAAGAPLPMLLGVATTVLSLVPFGAPVLYLPVAAFLWFSGAPWYAAAGLTLWGLLVVSTVDNLLRPLFISQATRLPIVLVFVGVIGGIITFGLLGVFVGPAIIAVALELWQNLIRRGGYNATV